MGFTVVSVTLARTEPSTLHEPVDLFTVVAGSIDAIDVNFLSEATNYSLRGGMWLLLCFSASDIS
jgi:hypothetical protein